MAGVDLTVYRFDFDLTFSVLLMHPDGTTYHRYGSRDHESASGRLSMKGLVEVMRRTLPEHEAYRQDPKPPVRRPKQTIHDLPPFARKVKKKPVDCVHCHMVGDAERDWAQERKKWRPTDIWRWPPPDRIGFRLERDDPDRVASVESGSPSSRAGLRAGDRIVSLAGRSILSEADVQAVLQEASGSRTTLPVVWEREGERKESKLRLASSWKVGTPLTFSWRSSKWQLSPKPGFGGRPLSDEDLRKQGLRPGTFAFQVTYLVTWGDDSHTGRNAQKAGIRMNDIFLSAAGKKDFASVAHFHAWFRLKCRPGKKVRIVLLRNRKRIVVQLPVIP